MPLPLVRWCLWLIVMTPLIALLPLLVLTTIHRLLSANATPPVGLLFASWLSCHPCCPAAAASCPFSTLPPPLVIHTGWLLHLILSRCFRLPSSHQHRRLLMRWLLTSYPVCLSFALTGCLCVDLVCPISRFMAICQGYAPTYLYTTGGGGLYIQYVHMQKNAKQG